MICTVTQVKHNKIHAYMHEEVRLSMDASPGFIFPSSPSSPSVPQFTTHVPGSASVPCSRTIWRSCRGKKVHTSRKHTCTHQWYGSCIRHYRRSGC